MIKTFIQLARLTILIIRRARCRVRGVDYSLRRMETLAGLPAFFPALPKPDADAGKFRKWIFNNRYLRYFWEQAAFVKNALKQEAGHLFVPGLNLSYVRNPKAASTSLSYAILLAHYPDLKNFELSAEKINFLTDVNLKKTIRSTENSATFFTVIRNPFARVVSVYHDFFESHSTHFIYDDYLFGIFKKGLSFSQFVDILQVIPDRLKDQHLKPQNAFLEFYKGVPVKVTLLKLEDQQAVNAFLSGFHLTMPFLNNQGTPYDYRIYYNRHSLQKVSEIYAHDISLFGYEAEYRDLKRYLLKKMVADLLNPG